MLFFFNAFHFFNTGKIMHMTIFFKYAYGIFIININNINTFHLKTIPNIYKNFLDYIICSEYASFCYCIKNTDIYLYLPKYDVVS